MLGYIKNFMRLTGQRCPSPHLTFLSKNQLSDEGPDSVTPVVIPALAPTLDKSLKADRSLCPVKALCYYLDRTSGRTKNWPLSPSKKALTEIYPLPLSTTITDQADSDPMQ